MLPAVHRTAGNIILIEYLCKLRMRPIFIAQYIDKLIQFYERLNRRSSGRLAVLVRASLSFSRKRASVSAAGISFFSIFSVFPLLVFTITALNPFIHLPIVQDALRTWLATAFPVSLVSLIDEVNALLTAHGSFTLIAMIGFLWAASGMFNTMLLDINYAWGIDTTRSKLQSRTIALVLVTTLAVIVVLSLFFLWLLRLFAGLFLTFWESVGTLSLPLFMQVLIIFGLYKFGPATHVKGKAALISTLAVTLAIELVTWGYTWYLNSEWTSYEFLYGSLGAIIGLLFWVYLSNLIVLFGAYLTEAIQTRWESENPSEFREPITFE